MTPIRKPRKKRLSVTTSRNFKLVHPVTFFAKSRKNINAEFGQTTRAQLSGNVYGVQIKKSTYPKIAIDSFPRLVL